MTVAVLKNRILEQTNRTFSETSWGAPSFRAFLALYSDLVAVDSTTRPATVELRETGADRAPSPSSDTSAQAPLPQVSVPGRQIRPDLWDAVLDYSSGIVYVWDADQGLALPGDLASDDRPQLPTIDPSILSDWRRAFAARLAEPEEPLRHDLQQWADGALPSAALPAASRRLWNGELKHRVLERLAEWFEERSIYPPEDLVIATSNARQPSSSRPDELRDLVLRVVRGMTRAELEELRFPAAALLRAKD